jgi:hypothetical protein
LITFTAPVGHQLAQSPQPMHFSAAISGKSRVVRFFWRMAFIKSIIFARRGALYDFCRNLT